MNDNEPRIETWDEAMTRCRKLWAAANLSRLTIYTYESRVRVLRRYYRHINGPAAFSKENAEDFLAKRSQKVKPATIARIIKHGRALWKRWFRIKPNPWEEFEQPKVIRALPRVIDETERMAFWDWVDRKYDHWKMPLLFLQTLAVLGCRIGELAVVESVNLADGRIRFMAETTKGRTERQLRLPPALFAELTAVKGKRYLWEQFNAERKVVYRRIGEPVKLIPDEFSVNAMVNWFRKIKRQFCEQTGTRYFRLHNFRGTAMSKARELGITFDDASIAFGCNPLTMRQHYLNYNQQAIADAVMMRLNGG